MAVLRSKAEAEDTTAKKCAICVMTKMVSPQ